MLLLGLEPCEEDVLAVLLLPDEDPCGLIEEVPQPASFPCFEARVHI